MLAFPMELSSAQWASSCQADNAGAAGTGRWLIGWLDACPSPSLGLKLDAGGCLTAVGLRAGAGVAPSCVGSLCVITSWRAALAAEAHSHTITIDAAEPLYMPSAASLQQRAPLPPTYLPPFVARCRAVSQPTPLVHCTEAPALMGCSVRLLVLEPAPPVLPLGGGARASAQCCTLLLPVFGSPALEASAALVRPGGVYAFSGCRVSTLALARGAVPTAALGCCPPPAAAAPLVPAAAAAAAAPLLPPPPPVPCVAAWQAFPSGAAPGVPPLQDVLAGAAALGVINGGLSIVPPSWAPCPAGPYQGTPSRGMLCGASRALFLMLGGGSQAGGGGEEGGALFYAVWLQQQPQQQQQQKASSAPHHSILSGFSMGDEVELCTAAAAAAGAGAGALVPLLQCTEWSSLHRVKSSAPPPAPSAAAPAPLGAMCSVRSRHGVLGCSEAGVAQAAQALQGLGALFFFVWSGAPTGRGVACDLNNTKTHTPLPHNHAKHARYHSAH